jgi:hypothetical protein
MRRSASYVALASAVRLVFALFVNATRNKPVHVEQPIAKKTYDKAKFQKPADPARKAVLASVRAFTDAFNRQGVKTLLTLFGDDCILTESDGTTVRGLKDLEAELKETVGNESDARNSVSIDSLQVASPDVTRNVRRALHE